MAQSLRAQIKITVDGTAHADMLDDLIAVTVDLNLHLPAMATVELFDEDLKWIKDSAVDLGKSLKLSFEEQPDPDDTTTVAPKVLFQGEITAVEPRFKADGKATVLYRAYDKSHRLHRGEQTRTFTDKTDSDIVTTIANEAGLTPEVETTSIKFPYLLQNNQTDMEFLLERARRIGYWAFAAQGKLYFKKSDFTLPDGPTLKWPDELHEFRPRLSGVGQPHGTAAIGWDVSTKKEIEGKATTAHKFNPAGLTKAAGAAAESAFDGDGTATITIVNRPVVDATDAKDVAQAALDDAASEYLYAEGECFGDTDLVAGANVTIKGVAPRFEGKYLVTAATHIYRHGHYMTKFTMSGRQPNTLRSLINGSHNNGLNRSPAEMRGVVVGVVTNTKDKDGMGRVKVEYPWLPKAADGKGIESTWARIAAPMAGGTRGFMFMPAVKDEVLVAFEHGDPNVPYVLGGLWNSTDTPPLATEESTKDGKTQQHMIKTQAGHVVILDDTSGAEQIIIRDKSNNNEIIINTKDNTVLINADKDINLTAKGNINLKATEDITFDGANFKVTAKADSKFDTTNFKVTAKANVDLAGLMVTADGKTGVTLKTAGVGKVEVSPAKTSINAGALDVM